MTRRRGLAALFTCFLLTGCTNQGPTSEVPTVVFESSETSAAPTSVPVSAPTDTLSTVEATARAAGTVPPTLPALNLNAAVNEVLPGVYATDAADALPLPTSGYDVYLVGESHGVQQSKQVFSGYLTTLHEGLGLRDIVLEEDQVYEDEANDYALGNTDSLLSDLCLRADILTGVRSYNEQLADGDKIRVHLVDVDSPPQAILAHLQALRTQIGSAAEDIQVPTLREFGSWSQDDAFRLVDQLAEIAGDSEAIANGLGTVRNSLQYYYAGNIIGIGQPTGSQSDAPIREDAITENVRHLVRELKGAPILVFFGAAHAMKAQGVRVAQLPDFQAWAQRLAESGIRVYSVAVVGRSGESYWRGRTARVGQGEGKIQLANGETLGDVMDAPPAHSIVYVDLRVADNAAIRLGYPYEDMPAGQIHDGLVLFREFTPMEDACR